MQDSTLFTDTHTSQPLTDPTTAPGTDPGTDPYTGVSEFDDTPPSAFECQGVDISHHQGDYDWDAAIERGGASFGIARLTIGGPPDEDDRFEDNWRNMFDRRDQLIRGVYHVACPSTVGRSAENTPEADAEIEANWFCDQLIAAERELHDQAPLCDGYSLPPFLDYEKTVRNSGGELLQRSSEELKRWLRTWIWTVQERLGRGVILYTGPNVWKDNFGSDGWLNDLPLWVAQYTSASRRNIAPWQRWVFWQWSGGGESGDKYEQLHGDVFPGAHGRHVDVNAFGGSLAQLRMLCDPSNDRWLDADGRVGPRPS